MAAHWSLAASISKHKKIKKELRDAADKYEHSGVPLSTAFAKYTSVDSQVTHMLSIGEKSASLDAQLGMLAEMYEEDLQNHMTAFAATVSFLVLIIAVLKENSQMYTTQIVDKDTWRVPFIAPKGKSVTWWLISVTTITITVILILLYLKELFSDPAFRNNFMDALKLFKNG
jgi:Type II secretion system (T2SS), protein F